jgi:hypothetical protein
MAKLKQICTKLSIRSSNCKKNLLPIRLYKYNTLIISIGLKLS